MLSGKSLAFVLVVASAFIHASWNVAAKSLKGNTSILILAHFFGALITLPLVLIYGDFWSSVCNPAMWFYVIPTCFVHGAYIYLLGTAYSFGEVGLVYPLARGTAITLATIATQVFSIGASMSMTDIGGIFLVVTGIFTLSCEAFLNLQKNNPVQIPVDISYEPLPQTVTDDPIEYGLEDVIEDGVELTGIAQNQDDSKDVQHTTLINSDGSAICENPEKEALQQKLKYSIIFALCVGCCTASYSIIDSMGVNVVPAITYSFFMNCSQGIIWLPYLYFYKYNEALTVFTRQKKYLIPMAPATTGAYLIILFVFEIPEVNLALVVTLREFSVLIGTLLGVCLLNESYSTVKITGVVLICLGMAVLKLF